MSSVKKNGYQARWMNERKVIKVNWRCVMSKDYSVLDESGSEGEYYE